MRKRIITAVLVLVLLLAVGVAVSAANAGAADPNEIYTRELDFSNGANPVCPWCGVQPEAGWTALDTDITETTELSGHYYLTGNRTNSADYACWDHDVCVYIGEYNITANGTGAFQVDGGKTLTVMGRGSVTGSQKQYAAVGATVDVAGNGGTLNLCGGTYSKSGDSACAVLTVRGSASSTVNMYAGTVIEKGDTNNYEGGNVRIVAPATFNMYGGTISGGTAYCGGNVSLASDGADFHMYGGAIENGRAELSNGKLQMKDEEGNEYYALGGNIYAPKGRFTQYKGATVSGGNAYTGGNLYYAGGNTVTLGGTVTGGTGFTGGNIDLRGGSTLRLPEGALISRGRADYDGGNIQLYNATLELCGGSITGGTAGRWGGNILADNGAQVNMTGGTITGGEATDTQASCGGNLYVGDARLTVSGGKITMGKAGVRGGNIHFEKTPYTVSLDGCEISYGQASAGGNISVLGADIPEGKNQSPTRIDIGKDTQITDGASVWARDNAIAGGGGNIFVNGGIVNISGQVRMGTADTTGGNLEVRNALVQLLGSASISGGQADYDGGNIAVNKNGQLVLDGSSKVTGGTAGRYGANVYTEGWTGLLENATVTDHGGLFLSANASLRIYNGFAGNVALSNLDLPENIFGAQLDKRFKSDSAFTGRLWLAQLADAPCLFGKDGGLVVGAAYTVKDGAKTWFADNAAAVAGYGDADYLVPWGDVELAGGNYVVDLAGQQITIGGTGWVTCFDSSNDTYETYGGALINGPVLQNKLAQTVNGNYYVRRRMSGVYSFHRLDLKISDVSLRVSCGGIYYSARWACDDAVVPLIQGFGIGVSLADMPGTNLRFDSDTKHTFHEPKEFVSGIKTNGVLISDILRDGATAGQDRIDQNSTYGKLPIYAKAYVILDNGVDREQTLVSNDEIAISMHDVLKSIERNMPHYYSAAQSLQNFKNHWAQNGLTGTDWDFDFTVPVEIVKLQQRFDSTQVLSGQLHDRLEEAADLSAWQTQMQASGIDFAACLEKGSVSYIGSAAWDDTAFIGGIEATFQVDGKTVDCSMLFAAKDDLEAVLRTSGAFTYDNNTFTAKALTGTAFGELMVSVKEQGGVFLLAHPKQIGLIESKDPLDYWFADAMAVDIGTSAQNYKLWTDLLGENKRVYAITANAGVLTGKADSLTLYTTQKNADSILAQLAAGNYTCGPVGMQMVLGDAVMGQSCDFTGKKLAIGVDQAAPGVLQADHTYRIDLITKSGIKASWPYTGRAVYELLEADAAQAFYRLEIVDETTAERLAVGNPIWNDDYGLKVGFARKDITPEYTVLIVGGEQRYGNTRKASDDGIFLTCVAVQEGDQTLLVYTADFINADDSYVLPLKRAVAEATGVSVENMLFNTTHTHSSVGVNYSDWSVIGSEGAKNRKTFLEDVNNAAVAVAQNALNDLTAVDGLYAGSVTGKKNVAFVRHYIKRDGTLDYSNTGKYDDDLSSWKRQYKAHATEADNEIQLVKFSRGEDKKPVVLMSVPAHATLNENSWELSADFPVYARTYIEEKADCLVAYFIGAAGDQVPRSKLRSNYLLSTLGVENNTDAKKYGTMLGGYAVTALKNGLAQLSNTSLKLTTSIYEGTIQPDTEARYNDAKALLDSYNAGTDVTNALKNKGFVEMSEVNAVVRRYEYVAKNGNIMPVEIKNMAIGDLGFVFAPYEMSGANGKQIKRSSPYANTFIVSCADDGYGYMASQDAYNHHSYEAWSSWLEAGSGEKLVQSFVEALEQIKYSLK